MRRVIAIANGKGGVGKTSLTAGLGGLIAAAGYRVLIVDADPQGNLRRDLGYEGDQGQSLAAAMQNDSGQRLNVLRDVRPMLDVVPGGEYLGDVPATAVSRAMRQKTGPALRGPLLRVLPDVQHQDYDIVLIDTPPGEPVIQSIVFGASDYLIIPTRSDEASLDGLMAVARRFTRALADNPDLTLLGVVLFGVRTGSKRLRGTVRAALEETLEGAAPVFEASIRYLESAAVDVRRRGLLPHELEQRQPEERNRRLRRLRDGESVSTRPDDLLSRDASGLAGDYQALAREVLENIRKIEDNRMAAMAQ